MSPKMVVLGYSTPMGINHGGTFFFRSNAILPMIFVGKTTPGPTQYWHFQSLQCFYYVIPNTPSVGNLRIRSYIDSFVDTSSEVFREMSIDVSVNSTLWLVHVDLNVCHNYPLLIFN